MSNYSQIRILFLTAQPTDIARLRLQQELRDIEEQLQRVKLPERFVLKLQLSTRPQDISQAIQDFKPNIVHFSGHGETTGELCFENELGRTRSVKPQALAALFRLVTAHVNCVVLNACHSDIQAEAIVQHIPFVIGMKRAIGDGAAIAFAVGFYKALGANRTIEEAYEFGCVEILLQGIPEESTPVLRKKEERSPQELERNLLKPNLESQIANLETKIQKPKRFQRLLTGIIASMMIITGISGFQSLFTQDISNPELFSKGERTFFFGDGNIYLKGAIEAFKKPDYSKAEELFNKAKKIDINDPEAEIYYNNARAYRKGNPLTLAVVVPVNARRIFAQEILKGVALAQANLNNKGGLNNRLLNIVIADDENNPSQAQKVAQELSKDPNVLGVIGHYTSQASEKAIPEYEKVGLAMISPGSTSTKLIEKKSKVFFRTTPSDKPSAQLLVDYAIKNNISKVIICYTSQDIFSVSLKEAFENSFNSIDRKVVETIDLADPAQDSSKAFFYSVSQNKLDAAVFFPNTDQVPIAINITQEIEKSQKNYPIKLQLLGGNTLYGLDTLQRGKDAIEGLTLTVPWSAEEANAKEFAKQARNRWQEPISWQNATSYDATQAFIKALSASKDPSRKTVLENIPLVQLSSDETSGGGLRFNKNGEREREPVLVKVVKVDKYRRFVKAEP
ncbi:MAG: ABC transporter substrate-binding protein [Hassallia sp. WJT32-NPBG1]|jgi:ABC-type branched-subunit amino acid transport system substrate-binding protein|nr:ABC transporter substrate-binding protein [Hassallia sp. WJT32-NPBG1]